MLHINRRPAYNTGEGSKSVKPTKLGSTSLDRVRQKVEKTGGSGYGYESLSAMSPTGMQNSNVSSNPISVDLDPMLSGFAPQQEHLMFYRLYRDMYYNDSVCGSAVDLMSAMPFGEFSLGGVSDRKALQVFNETIERLSLRTLLPEVSIDYLVLGVHCSSLLYSKERRMFVDTMPHAVENMTVKTIPFYSQDPIVSVKFPKEVQEIFSASNQSPRIARIRKLVGQVVVDKIASGSLELDPMSTLYIPRRTFTNTATGTSYFRRVLPLYLIEKNLYRGTLLESARRQRGILHLTLGDGEDWVPTVPDMDFMTELFMNADSDPLGAIIATRQGVDVNEIRQGGDFWKVTDFSDSVLNAKLRALGISESFLSGDANYNTADNGLTVFIDMLRSYREMMTRKIFYDKLFPLISLINGYTVNTRGKIVTQEGLMDTLSPEEALFTLNDGSHLLIPTVSWAKNLKPEGDQQYLDVLNGLTDKGVPVPIRMLAAAGGLNLDELLRHREDDLALRKSLSEYMKAIQDLAPKPEGGEGEESESAVAAAVLAATRPETRSAVLGSNGRVPLLSRDFGEAAEVKGQTKTGKPKAILNQTRANQRINKQIARAIRAADARGAYRAHNVKQKRK